MAQVVQAKCPGCKNVLRFPANWVGGSLRCKHCGRVVQTKPKSGTGGSAPASPPAAKSARPAAKDTDAAAAATLEFNPKKTPKPSSPPEKIPAPADDTPFGQLQSAAPIIGVRTRRPSTSIGQKIALAGFCLLLIGSIAGAVYFVANHLPADSHPTASTSASPSAEEGDKTAVAYAPKAAVPDLPVGDKPFPRRLLAICVSNYLYANPVTYGEESRTLHAILTKFCQSMHIPDSQFVELSDAGPQPKATLKPVIEKTISDFLATSRPQDRIMILFTGHAVEVEDEPYLVPIEGELGVKDTLIPLKWVYDQLAKCKARQKVLIADICRYDPARGVERPTGGAMGEKLEAMLQKPPAGVQVWSACRAKQYSNEGYVYSLTSGTYLSSGIFVDQLYEAVGLDARKKVPLGIQKPEDPLPLAALAHGGGKVPGVNGGTESDVSEIIKTKQTPFLSGEEAASGAPFNPNESLPPKLAIQPPPALAEGAAPTSLVKGILKETGARLNRAGAPLPVEALPVFSAAVLENYQDDTVNTPLREAVLNANKLLQKYVVDEKAFEDQFRGKGDDGKIKAMILTKQRKPAKAFGEMLEGLEELKKAGEKRDEEKSPRWQANYDFVLACLEAQLAYTYEYNFMLGQIRKDQLPPRDPAKHSGWGLASQAKLQSGAEARKLAADSQKILKKLAKEHKGTPYEVVAKREALKNLGLEWQPIP